MKSITAVLGPTNTGKTHLAVERMIGYQTGMIGLPLRLLAREVYDKISAKIGPDRVALVTGEEKILPKSPRFWVCTVEAMPPDLEVEFLAIDEIQLAADLDRGHIFTDRILHRRGTLETMLLGSATMRPMIERLLPGINFITRPRFSQLTFSGSKKMTRLPPRSAIVAFSAEAVYGIAELVRRQRGGAAVVMGALSPRTRNAQVELYENGDVDFLVATDAIGMGLNMDVNHVAFAQARKFDGFSFRDLTPAEIAQIAGRAGRHMNDGTFGVTGEVEPFPREIVDRIENHNFEPVRMLQWRNTELDFSSVTALLNSLNQAPTVAGLMRAQSCPDQQALEYLSRDHLVMDIAKGREAVQQLWDVCQIPDYRNTMGSDHANLVAKVYGFLSKDGKIPSDWFAKQLRIADNTEGDIDTLAARVAHVRTWTFIANRDGWLADAENWRDKTREIEDRLSDALHERLSQRFIDRRTSVLMKRMREKDQLTSSVDTGGEILVEGVFVGHIKGFHFMPDISGDNSEGRTLRAASMKAVAAEISDRAKQLVEDRAELFALTRDGYVTWRAAKVARLVAGAHVLRPRLELLADDQLTGTDKEAVVKKLEQFVEQRIGEVLKPLIQLEAAEDLQGLARGFAFRLVEQLGNLAREDVKDEVKQLDQEARGSLRRYGIRFGAFNIFIPTLLKPAPTELKLMLWALQEQQAGRLEAGMVPEAPPQGLTSVALTPGGRQDFYHIAGFRVCGSRAVRIDMIERLADLIRPRVFWKPQSEGDVRPQGSVEGGGFTVIPDMMSLVGCSGEEFAGILRALGFRSEKRKVPSAVAADKAPEASVAGETGEAVPAETGETTAMNEVSASPAAPDAATAPAAPVTEAAGEAAGAESADSPEPASAATGNVPANAGDDVSAAEVEAKTEAARKEPEEIEVWWPKDAGPFKRQHARSGERHEGNRHRRHGGQRSASPAGDNQAHQGRRERDGHGQRRQSEGRPGGQHGRAEAQGEGPRRDRHERPRREGREERHGSSKRDEARIADSPFAVLGALKAELLQKSRKGGQ